MVTNKEQQPPRSNCRVVSVTETTPPYPTISRAKETQRNTTPNAKTQFTPSVRFGFQNDVVDYTHSGEVQSADFLEATLPAVRKAINGNQFYATQGKNGLAERGRVDLLVPGTLDQDLITKYSSFDHFRLTFTTREFLRLQARVNGMGMLGRLKSAVAFGLHASIERSAHNYGQVTNPQSKFYTVLNRRLEKFFKGSKTE